MALTLRCVRWGVGRARRDPRARTRPHRDARLGGAHQSAAPTADLPAPRAPPEPRRARSRRSSQPAISSPACRADGLEFADTRAFVPGDRLRSVNWRASARRGELIVNERHPDRNADVVLFLDSFAEARSGRRGDGTLERAVRAAATLAGRYLERRDRVGLVTFGGVLRWLEPGGGLAPALPPDRRAARDRGRVQLRLEGRQHRSRPARCRRRRS